MLTLRDVRREASKHGASLTSDRVGDCTSYYVDAPEGTVWYEGDLECFVFCVYAYDRLPEHQWAYRDVIERMASGVHPTPK